MVMNVPSRFLSHRKIKNPVISTSKSVKDASSDDSVMPITAPLGFAAGIRRSSSFGVILLVFRYIKLKLFDPKQSKSRDLSLDD